MNLESVSFSLPSTMVSRWGSRWVCFSFSFAIVFLCVFWGSSCNQWDGWIRIRAWDPSGGTQLDPVSHVQLRRHVGSSSQALHGLHPARSFAQHRCAAAPGDHGDFQASEALPVQLAAGHAPLAPAA